MTASSATVAVEIDVGHELLRTLRRHLPASAERLATSLDQQLMQLFGPLEGRRCPSRAQRIGSDEGSHRNAVPCQRDLLAFADPLE
jgi:hypothetical protein